MGNYSVKNLHMDRRYKPKNITKGLIDVSAEAFSILYYGYFCISGY
jgi:hypothetical protein